MRFCSQWLSACSAQEITGSINGIVTDSTGGVLPGVQVTVTNIGTNVAKTVTTGPSGAYVVPFLFFGTYRVSAELAGFKTARAENVRLSTSEQVRVDLTLSVGDVTESVEVTAPRCCSRPKRSASAPPSIRR